VLSSSSRNQVSMESSKLRGGVFTYYLVRGLSGSLALGSLLNAPSDP
jgi:uncharacterized caspase-like protein